MTEQADRVFINGNPYLLNDMYDIEDIADFASQIRQGKITINDLVWESVTAQSSFHKGFGQSVLGNEERYLASDGCDARIPQQATLGPLLTALSLLGFAVDAKLFLGTLYLAVDQLGLYEYQRNLGTLACVSGTTFTGAKLRKGCMEIFANKLLIASQDVNLQQWDGGALTEAAAKKYDYICKVNKQLYGALRPCTLDVSTNGTTFATVTGHTEVHSPFTALCCFDGRLYIGAENTVYTVITDGTFTDIIPELKDTISSDNCVGMAVWRGMLRIPLGRQLITWTGSEVVNIAAVRSLTPMGFDESPESQASQRGVFHDLHGGTNFLWAVVEDPMTGNYYVYTYYERPDLSLGEGWHPVINLGTNPSDFIYLHNIDSSSFLLEHGNGAVTPPTAKYGTGMDLTTAATYDTTIKKFGSASIKLPAATACVVTSTQKVMLPASCCVEFWVYVTGDLVATTNCPHIVVGADAKHGTIYVGGSGAITAFHTEGGAHTYSTPALSLNTWHHLALHFRGASRVWLVDGVAVAPDTTFTALVDTSANSIVLSTVGTSNPSAIYFDEIRISKGTVYDTQRNSAYPTTDSPMLFLGYGLNVRTAIQPLVSANPLIDTNYRYGAAGTLTTSDIDLVLKGQDKAYLQLEVFTQQTAAGITITPYYSIDGGTFTAMTAIDTPGWVTLYFPAGSTGKRIALRFDFVTNDSTITPVLKAYQLKQFVRIPMRQRWIMQLLLADGNDPADRRTVKVKKDDLRTARNSVFPVVLTDVENVSWWGVVEKLDFKMVAKEKDMRPELMAFVAIKEWVVIG